MDCFWKAELWPDGIWGLSLSYEFTNRNNLFYLKKIKQTVYETDGIDYKYMCLFDSQIRAWDWITYLMGTTFLAFGCFNWWRNCISVWQSISQNAGYPVFRGCVIHSPFTISLLGLLILWDYISSQFLRFRFLENITSLISCIFISIKWD